MTLFPDALTSSGGRCVMESIGVRRRHDPYLDLKEHEIM